METIEIQSAVNNLVTAIHDNIVGKIIGSIQQIHAESAPRPTATVEPKPLARTGRPRGTGHQKRTAEELESLCVQVRAAIAKSPGQGAEKYQAELGISHRDIVLPIAKLLESGAIRKRGNSRSTVYFPKAER
jgi:hypothetical protein